MAPSLNWRSLLFVPADATGLLARAHLRGADGLILDLEDAVAVAGKEAARRNLSGVFETLGDKGVDLLVRINADWRAAFSDLEAAACSMLSAIVVPKVEDPARLTALSEILTELERERSLPVGRIGLVALVESPLGLARASELGAAPRVHALALGPEDFSLTLGVAPTPAVLELPCRQLALAAASRGVQCLAMPISIGEISNMDLFGHAALQASAVGCTGALCVHPAQVAVANKNFAVSAEALRRAADIITEWERAQASGLAVTRLNGAMIDRPVAERAARVLSRRSE